MPTRLFVITDNNIDALYSAHLTQALSASGFEPQLYIVPAGEASKSQQQLTAIYDWLLEQRAERREAIVALGGGMVGDLAGYAAATYLRGVPLIQVPTSLLAQVDAAIGGKTGINHPLGKNLVGAFWQPRVVLIDVDCLRTLPPREVKAGLSEVIKYGAIRDVAFFDWLEQNMDNLVAREPFALEHAVYESCRIKAEIVGGDERESGERALLNFGHTFGHAIETAENYGTWLHGEAVAAGMVLAARLSERVCGLAVSDGDRIVRLIGASDLPTSPPKIRQERWLELMARDKKVTDGRLRFVLLDAIGRGVIRSDVSNEDVAAVLTI